MSTYKEKCCCGAEISIELSSTQYRNEVVMSKLTSNLESWRAKHEICNKYYSVNSIGPDRGSYGSDDEPCLICGARGESHNEIDVIGVRSLTSGKGNHNYYPMSYGFRSVHRRP